jgi:hypothetical protein
MGRMGIFVLKFIPIYINPALIDIAFRWVFLFSEKYPFI